MNEKIKILTEDDTIDSLLEDQGKFGIELEVADLQSFIHFEKINNYLVKGFAKLLKEI